ncbi:sigma 54-interacting transcriptional regulator [Heliorestis convoluta]|uniref:sigma 54-interacting transcriptional regulator n=1 Tax=Heliorestis convoluta TaxID=356322 RepID=UPI00129A74F9|nr:sigma 54-interacting transcriptional regulator [Heliorestis convoluta]
MQSHFPSLTTKNQAMLELLRLANQLASKDLTILIYGEAGSGKEVLAHYIHQNSHRKNKPFITINCSTFTGSLLAKSLPDNKSPCHHIKENVVSHRFEFHSLNPTIFDLADQGTILLQEVAEASPETQALLLRILEKKEFSFANGMSSWQSNTRILASTKVNLEGQVQEGLFRQDLFYRLDMVRLTMPPLRKRLEDIPLLIKNFTQEEESNRLFFSAEAMAVLQTYSWPGNIAQLKQLLSWLSGACRNSIVNLEHLPETIGSALTNKESGKRMERDSFVSTAGALSQPYWMESVAASVNASLNQSLATYPAGEPIALQALLENLHTSFDRFSKHLIDKTLEKTKGDHQLAARLLGLTPRQLRYLYREKTL